MQPSPCSATTSLPASASAAPQPNELAERAYQALTIAAMLLLLYSLWLFR